MAAEYQESDWRVADYRTFRLDDLVLDPTTGRPLHIRGPRPASLEPRSYFVCLGAAQTFGRFCRDPYPSLLSERLKLPVLNISHGGAGPSFFCRDNARLLGYVNRALFVIVQVMSARSESNSLFLSRGVGHYERRSDGRFMGCDEAFDELLASCSQTQARRIVGETRQGWRDANRTLFAGIRVPSILFWFSTRGLDLEEGWDGCGHEPPRGRWRNRALLFGSYPQLVDRQMVERIRPLADDYIQCVSRRGMPQTLYDQSTGEAISITDDWSARPWTMNWYYPSPEMHADAADALEEGSRALMAAGPLRRSAAGRFAARLSREAEALWRKA